MMTLKVPLCRSQVTGRETEVRIHSLLSFMPKRRPICGRKKIKIESTKKIKQSIEIHLKVKSQRVPRADMRNKITTQMRRLPTRTKVAADNQRQMLRARRTCVITHRFLQQYPWQLARRSQRPGRTGAGLDWLACCAHRQPPSPRTASCAVCSPSPAGTTGAEGSPGHSS